MRQRTRAARPAGDSSTDQGLAHNYWNDIHAACQAAGAARRRRSHEAARLHLEHAQRILGYAQPIYRRLGQEGDLATLARLVARTAQAAAPSHGRYSASR